MNILNFILIILYNREVVWMSSKERELYEGIICKFLLNLPLAEQQDANRLSYHAQKAYYFYLDEILKIKPTKDWQKQRNQFLNKLKQYSPACLKINTQLLIVKLQDNKPVCGAIIFNNDHTKVLAIKVKDKYGFPKGKWNQNQQPEHCAARQVYEETGISVFDKIDSKIKIEFDTHGNISYFFAAKRVSEAERVKIDHKEIDEILWMKIEDVRKHIGQFVQRSRIAWNIYERDYYKKDCSELAIKYWKKDSENFDYTLNPLLNFKLDRNRAYNAIFASIK